MKSPGKITAFPTTGKTVFKYNFSSQQQQKLSWSKGR